MTHTDDIRSAIRGACRVTCEVIYRELIRRAQEAGIDADAELGKPDCQFWAGAEVALRSAAEWVRAESAQVVLR